MSLLGFEYFVEVAKEGNISKAAEKLYISQQSLSAHIKRLENKYGVTLFERKLAFRLTPAGEAMLFYVQQMLREEKDMTDRFADLVQGHYGTLRIGASRQRSEAFFGDIWERYQEKYPHIEVQIKEYNSDQLLDMLRTHQIDLCVGLNVPEARDIQVEPLVEEHLCCALSKSLLLQYRPETGEQDFQHYLKEGVDLLELQDLPFFHRPETNQIRVAIDQMYAAHSVYPHHVLETNNQRLMLRLASYGVCLITPIYLYLCWQSQSVALGMPQIVKLKGDLPSTIVSIVTLKDQQLPQYAQFMLQLIREEFNRYKRIINDLGDFPLIS